MAVVGKKKGPNWAKEYPIEKIVTERRRATKWGIAAFLCAEAVCIALCYLAVHLAKGRYSLGGNFVLFTTAAAFTGGAIYTGRQAYVAFNEARHMFYARRTLAAIQQILDLGHDIVKIDEKYFLNRWHFYWARDLARFEQVTLDYLRSFAQAEERLRRRAKWAGANAKLERQLATVLDDYEVTGSAREEITEDFLSYDNPERRKSFLAKLRSRLPYERWQALNHALSGVSGIHQLDPTPAGSAEDFRLKYLEKEAAGTTGEAARAFYRSGLAASSRHDKIRLFKRALSEDLRVGETETIRPERSPRQPEQVLKEVVHLSLQGFVRERLKDLAQFAPHVHWEMCREIISALVRPGQSGGRFNKHYFAEDTVKRMVRRQCNMYGDFQFDPGDFDKAVAWLLDQHVLVTKPKVDERTLSLSTNVKNATKDGAVIISMVLRLKREAKGLPS